MAELNEQEFETEGEAFLNELVRTAAHDLNNILSPIIGYPELLMDQFEPNSQEYEDLMEIRKLANRAIYLIKDVQMLIRPELKSLRSCDMNAVIRDVLQGSVLSEDAQARLKVVTVNLELLDSLPSVGSSRHVLQSMMSNLCSAMLIMSADQGTASLQTSLDGDSVELRVTHGVTELPEADVSRITEPFFLKKRFSSALTGLEITVVETLVRQHDGSYTVEYKNGELLHVCRLPVFKES